MLVYKYVTAARIDALKDSRTRFTQPVALNDPFESLACLTLFKEQRLKDLQELAAKRFGQELTDASDFIRQQMVTVIADDFPAILSELFAFLSVSKVPDNLLMWSHYADSHTGFVIGFDSDNEFFASGNLSAEGLKEVEYSRDRFVMPANGFDGLSPDAMTAANRAMFFTKSDEWKYEQEMRLLAQPNRADRTITQGGQPPIHLFNFPPKALQQVIFGFRTHPKIKDEIVGLLEEKYPWASILQARVSERQFGLEFDSYSRFAQEEKRLDIARELFKWKITFGNDT